MILRCSDNLLRNRLQLSTFFCSDRLQLSTFFCSDNLLRRRRLRSRARRRRRCGTHVSRPLFLFVACACPPPKKGNVVSWQCSKSRFLCSSVHGPHRAETKNISRGARHTAFFIGPTVISIHRRRGGRKVWFILSKANAIKYHAFFAPKSKGNVIFCGGSNANKHQDHSSDAVIHATTDRKYTGFLFPNQNFVDLLQPLGFDRQNLITCLMPICVYCTDE